MKIEQQVCTLEQAKRLNELGVRQESFFAFMDDLASDPLIISKHSDKKLIATYNTLMVDCYAAFTVSELGVMLPTLGFEFVKSNDGKGKDFFWVSGSYWKINGFKIHDPNEASARARMLIHLLESKIVTPDEINACLTS